MNRKLMLCMGAALLVSGCTSHTIRRDAALSNNTLGGYALPKAPVTFSVYYARTSQGAGLIVAAEKPRIVTGEILPLAASFHPTSADKFTIYIDPASGSVKKVTLNLDDRSSAAAAAAAAAAASSLGAIVAFNRGQ